MTWPGEAQHFMQPPFHGLSPARILVNYVAIGDDHLRSHLSQPGAVRAAGGIDTGIRAGLDDAVQCGQPANSPARSLCSISKRSGMFIPPPIRNK